METYLVKEGCGTHIVFDQGELDRHLKMGWTLRPADWLEKQIVAKKAARIAELRKEQAALEAEAEALAAPQEEKQKPGRKPKVAA